MNMNGNIEHLAQTPLNMNPGKLTIKSQRN